MGDPQASGPSPCSRQVGKRLFEVSGAQLDRPSDLKLSHKLLKRRKHTHTPATYSQAPPWRPPTLQPPPSTYSTPLDCQLK